MMQNFGDLTGKVPDALSQADIAMDQAGQALGRQGRGGAAAAQQRAADALKKGEQQMSQQMAQSLGISVQPGEGEGQGDGPGDQMSQDDGQGDEQGTPAPGDRDADAGQTGQDGERSRTCRAIRSAARRGTAPRAAPMAATFTCRTRWNRRAPGKSRPSYAAARASAPARRASWTTSTGC